MNTVIKGFFLECPLWGVLLSTLILLFFAFEGGFILGRLHCSRRSRAKEFSVDPMVAAILGLLAFMLAFTFGMSATHFNNRRVLVREEANAIRSVYLMTSLLSDGSGAESCDLLRDYVDARLERVESFEDLKSVVDRSSRIQSRLWEIAVQGEVEQSGAPSSWLYAQLLTEMFNKQFDRLEYGAAGRIMPSVWITLYWIAVLGMSATGYRSGLAGMRGFFAYLVLIFTFAMVMVMICDMDRPRQTLFHVSRHAIFELRQQMIAPGVSGAEE